MSEQSIIIDNSTNLICSSWISHGAGASERYRSFARPAVFSQDRLTFTMANHLEDQKSYHTCKLLVEELKRVIDEELRLRNKLMEEGVRDVTEFVKLPQNKVDQLDEDSADYDDKRLCHSCKHICFFSCVACECSKSKVSCLRHSHYMCRCAVENRYMMVWSTEEEMKRVHENAKAFAEKLKEKLDEKKKNADMISSEGKEEEQDGDDSETQAPGNVEDAKRHRNYRVDLSESSPLCSLPRNGQKVLMDLMNFAKRKPSEEVELGNDSKEKKQKAVKERETGVVSKEPTLEEKKVSRLVSEE